ncbi:MAG: hypothetical protein QMC90_05535, partial [Dehalococcoidales bacterium]|nr:hypothetical protein [Dehalococcoidales bacterium]
SSLHPNLPCRANFRYAQNVRRNCREDIKGKLDRQRSILKTLVLYQKVRLIAWPFLFWKFE